MKMFPVRTEIKQDGPYWLARCPEFDVISMGESIEEATRNLDEALILFVESCLRRGTFDQVLRESGISPAEIDAINKHTAEILPHAWAKARECHA